MKLQAVVGLLGLVAGVAGQGNSCAGRCWAARQSTFIERPIEVEVPITLTTYQDDQGVWWYIDTNGVARVLDISGSTVVDEGSHSDASRNYLTDENGRFYWDAVNGQPVKVYVDSVGNPLRRRLLQGITPEEVPETVSNCYVCEGDYPVGECPQNKRTPVSCGGTVVTQPPTTSGTSGCHCDDDCEVLNDCCDDFKSVCYVTLEQAAVQLDPIIVNLPEVRTRTEVVIEKQIVYQTVNREVDGGIEYNTIINNKPYTTTILVDKVTTSQVFNPVETIETRTVLVPKTVDQIIYVDKYYDDVTTEIVYSNQPYTTIRVEERPVEIEQVIYQEVRVPNPVETIRTEVRYYVQEEQVPIANPVTVYRPVDEVQIVENIVYKDVPNYIDSAPIIKEIEVFEVVVVPQPYNVPVYNYIEEVQYNDIVQETIEYYQEPYVVTKVVDVATERPYTTIIYEEVEYVTYEEKINTVQVDYVTEQKVYVDNPVPQYQTTQQIVYTPVIKQQEIIQEVRVGVPVDNPQTQIIYEEYDVVTVVTGTRVEQPLYIPTEVPGEVTIVWNDIPQIVYLDVGGGVFVPDDVDIGGN